MAKRTVSTSLKEDLEGLGLSTFNMTEQARLGGIPLTEDDATPKGGEERVEDEPKGGKSKSTNEGYDPLEDENVNMELFDAIMEIPFEGLKGEDVEEILEALKEKKIPEDASDELKERAEEVVDHLITEIAAKIVRRFKAGSVAKKKSRQCPEGFRQKKGGGCESRVKAMGGAGKVAAAARKLVKWAKSGLGKKSEKKSARAEKRRGESDEMQMSSFATELLGLMEDTQPVQETVRDELLGRIGIIMDLLSEEFMDDAVTRVFSEALEPVLASWNSGRLDEDVMDEDEFIAEIKPVLTLIHKSLDRVGSEDALGN